MNIYCLTLVLHDAIYGLFIFWHFVWVCFYLFRKYCVFIRHFEMSDANVIACICVVITYEWSQLLLCMQKLNKDPDSKVHGANMGTIWGRQDPGGPHVGPMNFAIWGQFSMCKWKFSLQANHKKLLTITQKMQELVWFGDYIFAKNSIMNMQKSVHSLFLFIIKIPSYCYRYGNSHWRREMIFRPFFMEMGNSS